MRRKRQQGLDAGKWSIVDYLDISLALESDDPIATLRELGPKTDHLIELFQARTREDIKEALRRWWLQ